MLSEGGQTVVFTGTDRPDQIAMLEAHGARVVVQPFDEEGRVDLIQVLRTLGSMQCNDVLVEAGAILAGRIVELGLADELIVYMAPTLLGNEARPMLQLPQLARLADRLQWRFHLSEMIGEDLKLVLRAPAADRA